MRSLQRRREVPAPSRVLGSRLSHHGLCSPSKVLGPSLNSTGRNTFWHRAQRTRAGLSSDARSRSRPGSFSRLNLVDRGRRRVEVVEHVHRQGHAEAGLGEGQRGRVGGHGGVWWRPVGPPLARDRPRARSRRARPGAVGSGPTRSRHLAPARRQAARSSPAPTGADPTAPGRTGQLVETSWPASTNSSRCRRCSNSSTVSTVRIR